MLWEQVTLRHTVQNGKKKVEENQLDKIFPIFFTQIILIEMLSINLK